MPQSMKSVLIIEPTQTDEQSATNWMNWIRNNHSAVADKYVPNAEETRKYLSDRE